MHVHVRGARFDLGEPFGPLISWCGDGGEVTGGSGRAGARLGGRWRQILQDGSLESEGY